MSDEYYGIRWFDRGCATKSMSTDKRGFFARIKRWKRMHSSIVEENPEEYLGTYAYDILAIRMHCSACKAKASIQLTEQRQAGGQRTANFYKTIHEEPCTAELRFLRDRAIKRRREDARRAQIADVRKKIADYYRDSQ